MIQKKVTIHRDNLLEGYFVPCLMPPLYFPDGDTICWRYDFQIPEAEAFQQQGTADNPKVYWLNVQAQPASTQARFGWKTSLEHWNDDGVWIQGREPAPGGVVWNELRYPQEHPMFNESIDLAFDLGTVITREEVVIQRLVADDWRCTTRQPVTAAVWWGSYLNYTYEACRCNTSARPTKPSYFLLSMWTDVPADSNAAVAYSHPGRKVWEFRANDYDEVLVGFDKHPEHPGPTQIPGREPVFRYSVKLPRNNWFHQPEEDAIYWFSVVAVYDTAAQITHRWGWTNHEHVFNDDAVAGFFDPANNQWFWEELFDQTGESEDMSFLLFTEPGCFPSHYSTYLDWLAMGKPDCWCAPYHCDGDGDNGTQGIFGFRIYTNDLNILIPNWKKKIDDPALDPCADYDHKPQGIFKFRVYTDDLQKLIDNWKKKNADLPGNCPRPE